MAAEIKRNPDLEWLDHVQPVGLVVAPSELKELGLAPSRQTQADSAEVAELLKADGGADDPSQPVLRDPWAFVATVLGWEARHVAGSSGGPPVPTELSVRLPEHDTALAPTWAVKELGQPQNENGQPWQLLVRIEVPGVDPDARGAVAGWEATPHQRFERLLRESGVQAGLLISERNSAKEGRDRYLPELRLIYAPRGETSGYLTFPVHSLATVAGRPMLGGLKLLLDSFRLFNDREDRRLPALLKRSREVQAEVSTALAEQVLGALHELLRGLDAADPDLIRTIGRERPGHLYEGLLTVLMRLVFILYAEDRDLLPSRTGGRARQVYETSYSLRGLYARLTEDAALNPDTMDERRGGWGQLLALFRLIHKGHGSGFVQARGGKLFDPDRFPFLEGRAAKAVAPRVLFVSDGAILRILEGLMTLRVKGGGRERLSYRTLDVEQIGSVYETVMGFTVETAAGRALAIKAGKNNRTPVLVDLDALAGAKGKDRIKFLKEEANRGLLSPNVARAVEAAKSADELAVALDPIVDERGSPKRRAVPAGTPTLQPTDERRRTGSHYTPRSLTEPIVRHALEPAFERLGPDATPEQVLSFRVCDPAMGSGAFLVEACRALSSRLVKAWERHRDKKPAIPPDEDEDLHARRLVAQRCLYGVDKNPLATDLARLSLWLATLARDHEFTFLDHALKSGDSLVGLGQEQIAAAHWDTSQPGLPLFRSLVKDIVAKAMQVRAEIQSASDGTMRAIQEKRHQSLETCIAPVRQIGDAVIAAFFAEGKPRARDKKRAEVESWLVPHGKLEADWDKLAAMAATLKQGPHPLTPFHWEIEFPEVFARENGGFDAIVGNPPFLGGTVISTRFGMPYFQWISLQTPGARHLCDLVAYFFRRTFSLLRKKAVFGLIATNSISQGDTREGGLTPILRNGGCVISAIRRLPWPGEAAVIVSVVHVAKGLSNVTALIDGRPVSRISSYLVGGDSDASPHRLSNNPFYSLGSKIYGQGFLFDDLDPRANALSLMTTVLAKNPELEERIIPYVGGEEINNNPSPNAKRFAIFLSDLADEEQLAQFEPLRKIVEERVKPERMRLGSNPNNIPLRRRWWAYQAHRPELYRRLSEAQFAVCNSQVSNHLAFTTYPKSYMYSQTACVIPAQTLGPFTSLQSRTHELWARVFGSSMKDDLRYTPSDCFETFPFPSGFASDPTLEVAGRAYHDHRAQLMVARNEGMTKTYNRFHDRGETAADIARLRELHAAMDRAVLAAYGWDDLAERAEPIFLDETNEDDHSYQRRLFWPSDLRDKLLSRLLALNADRHAEEVVLGIAPGMKGKAAEEDADEENGE